MENTLNFSETMTVQRFKDKHNVRQLDIIKNPKTGKMFFSCPDDSSISGKISTSDDWKTNPAISRCTDTSSGETFWMLHKKGEAANVVESI